MPFYEYECRVGHRFTEFFKSFSEAKPYEKEYPLCPVCTDEILTQRRPQAKRVPSSPLGFGLYGDPVGYDKPSPTKRFSTKTVSKLEGNSSAAG